MILFINGNKKRKNRRKLPFVIELHSGSQSGEFRNFLVHCILQKKHKISLKNSNYWVFWKHVIWHDTVPKWNKKRKNRRKLPFVIELHSGSQSGEFRNFLVHCNLYKKKHKISLKNSNYWVFWKNVIWHDTVHKWNKKRKNRRKLPFVIEVHSGSQSGEFRNFLVHCNLYKKNIKFRWKTQIIEFFEKMSFGMILFINGIKREKIEENFHLWLRFTPVHKVENFAIFWYIAIFKKNIKFRWKPQIIEFYENMLFGMILFLNGNKQRKNLRKRTFVIELHSGSQSGEFRNFLVHCNLQKKT